MKSFYPLMISVCLTFLLFSTGCRSRDMEAVKVQTSMYKDGYTLNLTIVLNDASSSDYEACAKEIITRCKENQFSNVLFSHDMLGAPSSVRAAVYAKKTHIERGEALFFFHYETNDSGEEEYTIEYPETPI